MRGLIKTLKSMKFKIVEHKLLEHHQYDIAQEYINYRTQRDFARNKATDINFTIQNYWLRIKPLSMKMPIRIAKCLTHNGLNAGTVAKAMGLRCCHLRLLMRI